MEETTSVSLQSALGRQLKNSNAFQALGLLTNTAKAVSKDIIYFTLKNNI